MSETAHETSHVTSHSERCILEGCITLMQDMFSVIQQLLEFGFTPEEIFEDDDHEGHYHYSYAVPMEEIVRKLFLSHTGHSGMTSCMQKLRELGYNDWGNVKFTIDVPKLED